MERVWPERAPSVARWRGEQKLFDNSVGRRLRRRSLRAPAAQRREGMIVRRSGGPLERDDGEVLSAAVEADFQRELRAGPSSDQGRRLGARRTTGPAFAWFTAPPTIGRKSPEIAGTENGTNRKRDRSDFEKIGKVRLPTTGGRKRGRKRDRSDIDKIGKPR